MRNVHKSSQLGMVSIMVTMLMMIVISLIVLGFAQVSRREQREALDRQLSTQAFFAAESGVNDARFIIEKTLAQPGGVAAPKTTCDADTNYNPGKGADPNLSPGVKYTCLLVSTDLPDVSGKASTNPVVFPLEPKAGTFDSLKIDWTTPNGSPDPGTCEPTDASVGKYPASTGWGCPYGVLRIDLVPTNTLSRAALAAGQHTMFLYPTKTVGATPAASYATADGASLPMHCAANVGCKITIANIPATGNYAIKLTALYADGNFIVAPYSGGSTVTVQNAQVLIDATGKANDVLRRIQVRLPVTQNSEVADGALTSGSAICKRFQYGGGLFSVPGDIRAADLDPHNPTCVSMITGTPAALAAVCSKNYNDIVLAIDSSASMGDPSFVAGKTRKQLVQDALNTFVDQAQVSPANNRLGFISWNHVATLTQALTGDPVAMHTAINGYATSWGTIFTSGLTLSNTVLAGGSVRPGVGKSVIFISDGYIDSGDTDAAATAAATILKSSGATVYTVGLAPSANNLALLRSIASDPSKYYPVNSQLSFQQALVSVASQITC